MHVGRVGHHQVEIQLIHHLLDDRPRAHDPHLGLDLAALLEAGEHVEDGDAGCLALVDADQGRGPPHRHLEPGPERGGREDDREHPEDEAAAATECRPYVAKLYLLPGVGILLKGEGMAAILRRGQAGPAVVG
ncbi:MAG: hypothetical protein P8Y69_12705 [Gammaproteobacteria bacterium]